MLRISMLSLICSLCSGVFGFGTDLNPSLAWAQGLFFVFLTVWMTSLIAGLAAVRPLNSQVQMQPFHHGYRTHRFTE